jgi:large subunit ribosomal protein L31
MKKKIHATYHKDVEVTCICGANFKVNATVAGPIKVETCFQCHPAFNKNKEVKKVIKGMMEKYLEKQKRIEEVQKKAA